MESPVAHIMDGAKDDDVPRPFSMKGAAVGAGLGQHMAHAVVTMPSRLPEGET